MSVSGDSQRARSVESAARAEVDKATPTTSSKPGRGRVTAGRTGHSPASTAPVGYPRRKLASTYDRLSTTKDQSRRRITFLDRGLVGCCVTRVQGELTAVDGQRDPADVVGIG